MTNDTHTHTHTQSPAGESAPAASAQVPAELPNEPIAPVTLNADDIVAYESLQNGAVFFEFPSRHLSVFTGEKAADSLNGLVTNDVLPIAVGRGAYAAALTAKGKMLADVVVLRTEPQTYFVESSEQAGREWYAMVRKYVNPRLAKYRDDSAATASIGVYGASAPALLARLGVGGMGDATLTDAMEQGLRAWTDWSHSSFVLSGATVRMVRAPHLGDTPGFVILAPIASRADIIKNLQRVGAIRGSETLWELASLEAARPLMGRDMDANTIPQEANLDEWSAISYDKGCYTGQETVARVHFRGHVNKHLRGLRSSELLMPGAQVFDATGKDVGDVRRSGNSPRLGPIAIAMIRREVASGSTVSIGAADGVSASVIALPFSPTDN